MEKIQKREIPKVFGLFCVPAAAGLYYLLEEVLL